MQREEPYNMAKSKHNRAGFDGQLYINTRGWKLVYSLFKVIYLWLTRNRRKGHWYFDA